jgi:hypothetical protein
MLPNRRGPGTARPTDRDAIRRRRLALVVLPLMQFMPLMAVMAVMAALIPVVVGPVWAQTLRRGTAPVRRATPPSGPWGRAIEATFFDDAFTTLVGPRPDFSQSAGLAAGPTGGGGGGGSTPTGDGFRWSALVSEETLTDEIKDMKEMLAAACATPSAFKGGGYDKARRGFSAVALAFSVIAAYDEGIRWQKDATTARDLFARAGFNCKVGTDQSFAEAKARLEDLDRLLQGSSPEGRPEREEDFLWSQVAGRPALMGRLEDAQASLRPAAASAGDFNRHLDAALHAAEIVAVIGEVIQRRDYEYHDDDSYRGHSTEMRDAAAALRKACQDKDYEAARTAAGRIEKACNACHGDYRG